MYRIDIYQTTGTSAVQTVLFSPAITVRSWGKRINAAGKMVFSMQKFHEKATEENLRHYRRVRLYRKKRDGSGAYEAVWFGYIEATNEVDNEIEVLCVGMLDLFLKRYTGSNELFNGQGSTEAFGLLTDTNTNDENTGIVTGTGGVTTTRSLTMDSREILRAWEQLAQAHNAEFEIDDNGAFNFVSALGSNKSSIVTLVFRRDGQPGSNVNRITIGDDGNPMANRVIGVSSGTVLTSTQSDATSIATYGLLIERKNFNDANDQTTLDSITSSYLSQRAYPITDFRVEPSLASKKFNPATGSNSVTGLQYGDVVVGDLVTVHFITENLAVSTTKRIAEIEVDIDENGQEDIKFTLSQAGVFITAAFLDSSAIEEIKLKLKEIEAQL